MQITKIFSYLDSFHIFSWCQTTYLYCLCSGGMNTQYMNQAAGASYAAQAGVAMDIPTYHNSSMPPVSYPVVVPPHQAPQQQQQQQQQAAYYQQPLL